MSLKSSHYHTQNKTTLKFYSCFLLPLELCMANWFLSLLLRSETKGLRSSEKVLQIWIPQSCIYILVKWVFYHFPLESRVLLWFPLWWFTVLVHFLILFIANTALSFSLLLPGIICMRISKSSPRGLEQGMVVHSVSYKGCFCFTEKLNEFKRENRKVAVENRPSINVTSPQQLIILKSFGLSLLWLFTTTWW